MHAQFDVVIVGAGLCGGLMADALTNAGLKVLILEAGADYIDRQFYLDRFYQHDHGLRHIPESPYPDHPQAPFPRSEALGNYYLQTGPKKDWFQSTYLRMVGGTTLHWLGTALRFHPDDFKMRTLYGQAKDWPLSYQDLEPWYGKAEDALGVAGNSDIDYGSPRSKDYPMPEIKLSYLSTKLKQALAHKQFGKQEIAVIPTPQSRNSVHGYQNRPACCNNHSCIPICPIQAKYDALQHLRSAQKNGAVLQAESVVTKISAHDDGKISAVHYLRWDGSQHRVTAKVYVLAAHAIETPKILLNSATDQFPNGIANRSDQVGRNLMDHPSILSYAHAHEPVYPMRSPLSTGSIESLRNGAYRKKRSSFRVQINDDGWMWPKHAPYSVVKELAKQGLYGEALNQALTRSIEKQFSIVSLLEMLPNPNNRITLGDKKDALGIARPHITFKLDDYVIAGFKYARDVHEFIFKQMSATDKHHIADDNWFASGHIIGTTVMGDSANTSVVNKDLRAHDHENLFILGSNVFPTSACSNPSLTIAALTLKSVQIIIKTCRELNS